MLIYPLWIDTLVLVRQHGRSECQSRHCGGGRPPANSSRSTRPAAIVAMTSRSCGPNYFARQRRRAGARSRMPACQAMTRKTTLSARSRCSSAQQGWTFEVIADLGSGVNYHKKGLKRLLEAIIEGSVGRLVITHKDRLLRFGAELVFAICEAKRVEVVILNQGVDTTFEEDLAKDVLEIIAVFSARLYGARSRKNQKLLDGVRRAVEDSK
jgi:Resolvase, N terminal domain